MARKKKVEEPVEEEIKTSELSDELKERINEVMDVVNTTATATTSDGVEPVSTVATCSIGETVDTTKNRPSERSIDVMHTFSVAEIRHSEECSSCQEQNGATIRLLLNIARESPMHHSQGNRPIR